MHDAAPSRCTCSTLLYRERLNVQTVLQTKSTVRTRLRYWRQWARTTGIEEGWMVAPTQPVPNLPKTDGDGIEEGIE